MKKKKIKIILKNLRKTIKPHQIIFIIVMLVGNTYAWFVYSNKVSGSVNVHVRAWNVLFQAGESTISDFYYVDIPNVYPGMNNYESSLTIENASEIAADITYDILEAKIYDEDYITVEGRNEYKQASHAGDLTSEQLISKLASDYPFKITFNLTNSSLTDASRADTSTSDFTVVASWTFESGDDELDTYWGNKAYEYALNNPGSTSEIQLTIKVFVSQSNS